MTLGFRRQAKWPFPPGVGADQYLRDSLRILRTKWGEVPGGEQTRLRSEDLLKVSDSELLRIWNDALADPATGAPYTERRG